MASALTDQGWWDWVPQDLRQTFRPIVNFTNPLGNQLYDTIQRDLNQKLKNLGGNDVGLLSIIPQNIRQGASGIAQALADPLDLLADRI